MDKTSNAICYGSLITLKTLENFYLYAQGFIENSPYLIKDKLPSFSGAVFRIVPSSAFSIQSELLEYTQEIRENEFVDKYEKLTKLEDSLEGEIKTNMQTYNSLKGKIIKYDSLIQLEHIQSHKFLTLECNEIAEVEKENLKVTLEDFPSEYSHFKISPGYNYQKFSDGVVRSYDKIHLEIMIPELRKAAFLHSSRSLSIDIVMNGMYSISGNDAENENNHLEVNISLDQKTKWVVSEFSASNKEDNYLVCGDYIWITKPEDLISLSVSKNKGSKHNTLIFTPNYSDTNGLWMIEYPDASVGGLLSIDEVYRLKHISTNKYLAIDSSSKPVLNQETSENTLWRIIPLEPENKLVRIDEMCLIINIYTQTTIALESLDYHVVAIPFEVSENSIDEDSVYKITRAGGEVVWETFFTLHCYPILKAFRSFIMPDLLSSGADAFKAIHEFKKQADLIEVCIQKLIQFCNNKLQGMIGIDNHYGEVQLARQKMLKEQGFFEILTDIVEIALNEPVDYNKVIELATEKDKSLKKFSKNPQDLELVKLKHITMILKKIYLLLRTLCHKNNENQIHAYKYFPIYMKHIGLNLGASEFMLSVLTSNEQLMLSISNPQSFVREVDVIEYFAYRIQSSSKEMKIKLLEFFKLICVFKGHGVTANQEKVFRCIMKDKETSSEILTKTIVDKGVLCIDIDGVNLPLEACFESGRIAVYFHDVAYFTKLLELYANMCCSRNFEVSAELLKHFPFEPVHSLMWNSEISDEIRAAFCKLLLNLYIDRSPREEVQKPQLIKEFRQGDDRNHEVSPRLETLSIDLRRKEDLIKISDNSVENLYILTSKENVYESTGLLQEDSEINKLLENIFEYFERPSSNSLFTCEILRLTAKLMKFDLLGTYFTDFENERIIQNPRFKVHELDIVRILKSIVPLLKVESKKSTIHQFVKKRRSTKINPIDSSEDTSKHKYVYLSSLLQDTGNIKDPLIRSAANLKNFITAFKQSPLSGQDSKSNDNRLRLKISKMLHYYLDSRHEFLINNIVAWFNNLDNKLDWTTSNLLNLLPPIMKVKKKNNEHLKNFLKEPSNSSFLCVKGPFIPDLNHLSVQPILPILFEMFIYSDSYKLQTSVFSLIMRCYEQRKELLKNVSMLLPISNAADIELLNWLKLNVKKFATYSEQSELWLKYWRCEGEEKATHFKSFKSIMRILTELEAVFFQDTIIDGGCLSIGSKSAICESRQKMMNYLNLDNLVISLIKDGFYELVLLHSSKKHKKHRQSLTDLFKLCFSFLQKFVMNNRQNQKRTHANLHIFFQNLNIQLGQIELICEIFKNNIKLIEKINEDFLSIFKELVVKYGRRPIFLEILKTIQVVNGKAVPSTQRMILNMFIQENLDLYLLYMDDQYPPEFIFDQVESKEADYYDEPYAYHAVLLEVLANCGYGVTGMYFNEAKCQNIVKLSNIFNILFKAEDGSSLFHTLKIPTLDFFYNIYLDCEIINLELKTCEQFFKYISLQRKVIEKIEVINKHYLEFTTLLLKVLLKYRQSYIKKIVSYDNKDTKVIRKFINSLVSNVGKFELANPSNEFVQTASDLCDSFGIFFNFSIEENEIHFEVASLARPTTIKATREEPTVICHWKLVREALIYNKDIQDKIQAEEHALLVAIHFSSTLSDVISFEKILKTLVNFIRLSRSQQSPMQLTISAIELVAMILANPIHDKYTEKAEAKKNLQNSMIGFGLVRVVFGLMCDNFVGIQIFKSIMAICIELLDGGNEDVQNEIYIYFTNTSNSEIFFERIHQMFLDYSNKVAHGGLLAIKRSKVFKKKQHDIKSLLRLLQLFCEGHNLLLQNYVRSQNRSSNSYDMIADIIAILEILIEKKLFISFPVMSQCFDTLTEFVQGPCAKNQESIIDGKFLELAYNLLILDEKSNTAEVYNCVKKNDVSDTNNENLFMEEDEAVYLSGWMIAHLKYKCMITIFGLLEGRVDNYVITRLVRTLNLEVLKENLKSIFMSYAECYGPTYYDSDIFDHIKDNETYEYGSNDNKQDLESKYYSLVVETGFMIYHLIKIFMESDDPESQELIASELDQLTKFKEQDRSLFDKRHLSSQSTEIDTEAVQQAILNYKYYRNLSELEQNKEILLASTFKFFDKYTGIIEVVFHGKIFKVYFSLPAEFRGLTPEIKKNFHRHVNRDTDQTKLKYLLKSVNSIIEQIQHEHFLLNAMQNNRIVSLIASKVYIWRDIAFALTVALNIVVLLSFSVYDNMDRMHDSSLFNYNYDSGHLGTGNTIGIIKGLGITQLICCLTIVAFFLLKVGPMVARRGWNQHKPTTKFLKSNPSILKRTFLKIKQIVFTVFYVLTDFHVLYHIAYTIFSVLGIFTHPFYFSLLLLDILYKYPSLQNVVKSFIVPRKALILTFCMMIVFMYLFAILGYMYFQEDFNNSCRTLLWCTITLWDGSFKNNGMIGGYMKQFDDGDLHTGRFFYDNVFNILLDVIIMGVVEGLIIDTFAMLREQQERSSNDMETKCFICGLERDYIERKTNLPFSRHVEVEHNEWNYVLFIAYLKRKEETEYTGIESYVKMMYDKGEINWIPNHKALGIKDDNNTEESESIAMINSINERLERLEKQVNDIKLRQLSISIASP